VKRLIEYLLSKMEEESIVRMLSDAQLLEIVYLAKRLGLDEPFLALLMEEVKRREIEIKEEDGAALHNNSRLL